MDNSPKSSIKKQANEENSLEELIKINSMQSTPWGVCGSRSEFLLSRDTHIPIMNEFALLSFSTFVYFTCHILDEGVCDASGRFHRDKTLTYAVFKDHFFHNLDVPIVEATIVETERNCLLRCVKHFQCFSTNIAAFSFPNGTILCVLLSTDKYSAPERFRANHSFHHFCIEVSRILLFLLLI